MKLTRILSAAALLGALVLTSCKENPQTLFPVYAWDGVGEQIDPDAVRAKFQEWKDHGVVGVCIGSHVSLENTATVSRIAHELGLEYHAWEACMLRAGLPHGWYAVNRLGQSADDFPAFVDYYKALDPRNPEVRAYLVDVCSAIAEVPDVDYVHLDYIRYPDVILARGLWDKYGLTMEHEYAPADYCYCDDCVAAFREETGIDIRAVEDPEQVPEWADFRCRAVTGLVEMIAEAVHAKGKKLSAAVFPGPDSHARWMVRQQWDEWPLDMVFPMNYNDFYLEPAEWLETITAEEVGAAGEKMPVVSGLFICPDWQRKMEVDDPENSGLLPSELGTAIAGIRRTGAAGICLFTPGRMSPEHWTELEKAIR